MFPVELWQKCAGKKKTAHFCEEPCWNIQFIRFYDVICLHRAIKACVYVCDCNIYRLRNGWPCNSLIHCVFFFVRVKNGNLFIRFHKSQPTRCHSVTWASNNKNNNNKKRKYFVHKNRRGRKKKYPFACQIIIYDYINHLETMVYGSIIGEKTNTLRFNPPHTLLFLFTFRL